MQISGYFTVWIAVLSAIRPAHIGAQDALSDQIAESTAVYLVIDEHRITDGDRARLYERIAELENEHWRKVDVKGPVTPGLIARTIDTFYAVNSATFPKTTKALEEMITERNKAKTDHQLDIPPLPLSANAIFNYAPTLRVFDSHKQGYARAPAADLQGVCTAKSADLSAPSCPAPPPAPGPVQPGDHRRGTNLTAILVSREALRESVKRDPELNRLLGTSVLAVTENGMATLHFSQDRSSICRSTTHDWLSSSPYWSIWTSLSQGMSNQQRASIIALASSNPLHVLDFDIAGTGSHGSKVMSTVQYMLHGLGFDDLAQAPYLQNIDLDPKNDGDSLKSTLTQFLAARQSSFDPAVLNSWLTSTMSWLSQSHSPNADGTFQIPDLLLQAIIWKYFDKSNSWMNMSFSVSNTTLDITSPSIMIGSHSYGFLAAGNDAVELDLNSIPQAQAAQYPNFVNVTYGDSVGNIFGAYSGSLYNTKVTVVAPGCGFSYNRVAPEDYGSSLASPYVAAAAWLRFLITGGSYTPDTLKLELASASHLIPSQTKNVESGGIFDAAMYLTRPSAHFLDAGGLVTNIRAITLTLKFADGSVEPIIVNNLGQQPATRSVVLSNCSSGNAVCLWHRLITVTPPSIDLRRAAVLSDISGSITRIDGTELQVLGLSDFSSHIKELWY